MVGDSWPAAPTATEELFRRVAPTRFASDQVKAEFWTSPVVVVPSMAVGTLFTLLELAMAAAHLTKSISKEGEHRLGQEPLDRKRNPFRP